MSCGRVQARELREVLAGMREADQHAAARQARLLQGVKAAIDALAEAGQAQNLAEAHSACERGLVAVMREVDEP